MWTGFAADTRHTLGEVLTKTYALGASVEDVEYTDCVVTVLVPAVNKHLVFNPTSIQPRTPVRAVVGG